MGYTMHVSCIYICIHSRHAAVFCPINSSYQASQCVYTINTHDVKGGILINNVYCEVGRMNEMALSLQTHEKI